MHPTLSTPSDIKVGHFARECQISHLIGRVLRHVFDPTPDADFHAQEALQLERTLKAFMPLLVEEHTKYGLYCAALAMCSKSVPSSTAPMPNTQLSKHQCRPLELKRN